MGNEIKALNFHDMIDNVMQKQVKAEKEFKQNGGLCLNCGKNPGEKTSTIDPFNCKDCNMKVQKAIDVLSKSPGFRQIRIPIK